MRKLSEPHGLVAGELRRTRARRRAAGIVLATVLAATASLTAPLTAAQAIDRHQAQIPASSAQTSTRGEVALRFAIAQLGKPYRYGGSGPNAYDCSGLAQRAWRAAGVAIPRTTQAQARFGAAVPLSRIRDGDLVIFYPNASHVGIYAGHGEVIVAPHSGKVVSYAYMRWMPIHTIHRPG